MPTGDPVCPICKSMVPCNCNKAYKPVQYFTPEPRWKDKDGIEYVGLVMDMPLFKANEVNKNGDVFTQEAADKAVEDWNRKNEAKFMPSFWTVKESWEDPRPSWDAYFMSEAFRVSRRSLDKDTKHGCVFVRDKRIVSTGYNSPPPGFDDAKADLERPGKYIIMEHSERAAICNAARAGVSTLDAVCYVTGFPCSDCYRAMWSAGIKEIIWAPIALGSKYNVEHLSYLEAARLGPKLTKFTKEHMKEVIKILDDEYDYIMERIDFNTPDESPST